MKPRLALAVQFAARGQHPERAQVRRWVAAALALARCRDRVELVVRFSDEAEARGLNRSFRGRDYATNVLTFVHQTQKPIAADIVLCQSVLAKEAKAQQKSVRDHTAHLVVHGVLHALGYDHDEARKAEEMEALEGMILARFRIADPYR